VNGWRERLEKRLPMRFEWRERLNEALIGMWRRPERAAAKIRENGIAAVKVHMAADIAQQRLGAVQP
jgi:hypothetical protein